MTKECSSCDYFRGYYSKTYCGFQFMKVAQRIKELRIEKGMTQKQLAQIVGCSQPMHNKRPMRRGYRYKHNKKHIGRT